MPSVLNKTYAILPKESNELCEIDHKIVGIAGNQNVSRSLSQIELVDRSCMYKSIIFSSSAALDKVSLSLSM